MQLTATQLTALQERIPSLLDEYRDRIPWLHAVGIGRKSVAGAETDSDALVFFVGQKLQKASLSEDELLPNEVEVQVHGKTLALPTDVVETPPFTFLQMCNDRTERPAKGGNCVSPQGAGWHGTLGGIVINPSGGRRYIVSNAHVLAGINQFSPGHLILQNHAGLPIARLTRAVRFTNTAVMTSDSAIAEVGSPTDVDTFIYGIGTPAGIAQVVRGSGVQKSGARTCRQAGSVRYVGVTITLNGTYKVRDCFLTDVIGQPGDSGSLILNMERRIVGLLFAGNEQYTAANPIQNVISDLQLSGWTW